jgi:HD superfamily phosphohydrolase
MRKKDEHEIRDPIHVFIRLDTDERKVLDSPQLQRLRHIHQLALTYLVYPGATHRRFEHSLGVMELATRAFDVITTPPIHEKIRYIIPSEDKKRYWRRVLRMAALCHDIGHLPFSHAAEKELLPVGWDHERLTKEIIRSNEMKSETWEKLEVPVKIEDIIKVALGPKGAKELIFNEWETILSEIITGDTFGVDRMDYLLRDSLHTGVAYGRFDHYRLIDTLRILPKGGGKDDSDEPTLGLDYGGIQSAEALLWARYFMFSQVYFHQVRRIYDIHLKDFLEKWLENGKFSIQTQDHLSMTDVEVLAGLRKASSDKDHPAHVYAKRIIERDHFKLLYSRNPNDQDINLTAGAAIYEATLKKYSPDLVRCDEYNPKDESKYFPVICKDGRVLQSVELSDTLLKVPVVKSYFVFIDRELQPKALKWLEENRSEIIKPKEETEE